MAPPFRLTPPPQLEQPLHEAVVRLAYRIIAPPAFWFCYPAGAVKLSPDQVAKLSRMGLRRGLPDFFILHASRIYGMELKRVGGKLSETRPGRTRRGAPRILEGQVDVFPQLEAAGMQPIAVCYTLDEVERQWQIWRIPLRGRIAA